MDSMERVEEISIREETTENGLDLQESEILEQHDSAEMGELPLADWDYLRPKRGQVRTGVILAIHDQEIIVGVDAKRDGVVPYADMQRLGQEEVAKLSVGDQVPVYILRPEDQDGNLLVSLFQARQASAWQRAAELAESGEAWEGEVVGYNKGGLLVPLDSLRGFVPASQVPGFPQGLNQEERLQKLASMVGETLTVKVIEINRRNRRLILSATAARPPVAHAAARTLAGRSAGRRGTHGGRQQLVFLRGVCGPGRRRWLDPHLGTELEAGPPSPRSIEGGRRSRSVRAASG